MTATLTKWCNDQGRHEIFAGGKAFKMQPAEHSMLLREGIVTQDVQHDLDKLGIAKKAREEKIRARDAKLAAQDPQQAEMARPIASTC